MFAKVGVAVLLFFPFQELFDGFKAFEVEVAKKLLEMLRFQLAAIGNTVECIPLAHELDGFDPTTEIIEIKHRGLGWLGFVEMEVTDEK